MQHSDNILNHNFHELLHRSRHKQKKKHFPAIQGD